MHTITSELCPSITSWRGTTTILTPVSTCHPSNVFNWVGYLTYCICENSYLQNKTWLSSSRVWKTVARVKISKGQNYFKKRPSETWLKVNYTQVKSLEKCCKIERAKHLKLIEIGTYIKVHAKYDQIKKRSPENCLRTNRLTEGKPLVFFWFHQE